MTTTPLHTDAELLQQLAAGSPTAFTHVYHQYYPELFFLSRRLVGDKASDILADVFLQLWTQHKLFESPQHLLAYLRVMTRNRCLDVLKQQERQHTVLKEVALSSDEKFEEEYFREIVEGRLFSLILREIDQLPAHLKKVFTLSYIDGMTNAQIAETLQLSSSSVRVLKSQALQRLRTTLHDAELVTFLTFLLLTRP